MWLLIFIAALPQVAETIYSPALPDIAQSLAVSDSWVEYTLTIYLGGFAIGTLFWGRLSDKFGRKLCLLFGIGIFALGCMGCYYSTSITSLMISRFVQSFGGSTGSVLGQSITRDAFRGVERSKVYATVAGAIALSPILGPFIGGVLDQSFGWSSVFLFLTAGAVVVFMCTLIKLPETHLNRSNSFSLSSITKSILKDSRIMGFALIVGATNGIYFTYYAEGSFYLIDILGLSPSTYGLTFVIIACSAATGAWMSRRLHDRFTSQEILWRGILLQVTGGSLFVFLTLINGAFELSSTVSIITTLLSMSIISAGGAIVIPMALSLALEDYQHAVGAASSFFGFFYYALVSLFTLIMGLLHNDTLYPMPLYFLGIALFIMGVYVKYIAKQPQQSLREQYENVTSRDSL